MDISVNVVTKFVKVYEALSPQITQLYSGDSKSFMEITTLLNELNALISQPSLFPLITPEFLSEKFMLFESVVHKQWHHCHEFSIFYQQMPLLLSQRMVSGIKLFRNPNPSISYQVATFTLYLPSPTPPPCHSPQPPPTIKWSPKRRRLLFHHRDAVMAWLPAKAHFVTISLSSPRSPIV
ncbi:unnamed protein product [Lactuca saligna]|uniref:Uncharacterized protein n=1 Tax=Lactuca saligna TaxID=75948 RepID=A0AA36E016_LACSI|nr:unnamed protein product [Lactuca saligna]